MITTPKLGERLAVQKQSRPLFRFPKTLRISAFLDSNSTSPTNKSVDMGAGTRVMSSNIGPRKLPRCLPGFPRTDCLPWKKDGS